MHRLRFPLAVACVLLASPFAATARDDAAAARLSDRMLAALVEANGVPGMGAAVARDGRVVWTGSAGYRDLERRIPVDAGTSFRLASVSKAIAATAAAKLHEEGRLDVDAPVQGMLPWLAADWPALSARQLASHSSGLPHYQAVDAGRGGTRYDTVRDAVAVFENRALLSRPGTAYSYSSWGYTLLSAVIEASAGQPFLDYVGAEIAPGLAIGPDATDGGDPAMSKAYVFADGVAAPAPPHDFSYTWAGGGLASTPAALATFGARLMAGDIVSAQTLAWMRQPTRLADGATARERDYEVGFGWRVGRDADGAQIAHHAGVTVGARSALVLWPKRRFGVGLLSNALWVSSIEQTAMMLAAPFQPEPPAQVAARACPRSVSRYSGTFGAEPVAGSARFVVVAGMCSGRMSVGNAFGEWLNALPQEDAATLEVIGLDRDGGLSRAALVTPAGICDLRAQADGGWVARISDERSLAIVLE